MIIFLFVNKYLQSFYIQLLYKNERPRATESICFRQGSVQLFYSCATSLQSPARQWIPVVFMLVSIYAGCDYGVKIGFSGETTAALAKGLLLHLLCNSEP
ncbi:MAG: hypothetical protein DRI69_06370 [Bacteroidetes bacterium]|nr:MAG: hypothetical protein DRI69_06370 [Bacteroidota bacterium]